jgi:hypothetical protein
VRSTQLTGSTRSASGPGSSSSSHLVHPLAPLLWQYFSSYWALPLLKVLITFLYRLRFITCSSLSLAQGWHGVHPRQGWAHAGAT